MLYGHLAAENLAYFTKIGLLRTKDDVDKDLQAEVILQIYLGFLQINQCSAFKGWELFVCLNDIFLWARERELGMERGENLLHG